MFSPPSRRYAHRINTRWAESQSLDVAPVTHLVRLAAEATGVRVGVKITLVCYYQTHLDFHSEFNSEYGHSVCGVQSAVCGVRMLIVQTLRRLVCGQKQGGHTVLLAKCGGFKDRTSCSLATTWDFVTSPCIAVPSQWSRVESWFSPGW